MVAVPIVAVGAKKACTMPVMMLVRVEKKFVEVACVNVALLA
jgi:hypothetical protein